MQFPAFLGYFGPLDPDTFSFPRLPLRFSGFFGLMRLRGGGFVRCFRLGFFGPASFCLGNPFAAFFF